MSVEKICQDIGINVILGPVPDNIPESAALFVSVMKVAIYLRNRRLENDARYLGLIGKFVSAGCAVYEMKDDGRIEDDTDIFVSVGGDGTFLSSAVLVGDRGIPVLGVNLGRVGFLSENRPDEVVDALLSGKYTIEERTLLQAVFGNIDDGLENIYPYALNEITIHRAGPAMLGVDVSIDGNPLPTYWADGLLVATSSGSTAYSLSVGGPIVMPESKVLIVSPISPHNLNVRPLVVPDTSEITLSLRSREEKVFFTIDNRSMEVSTDLKMKVSMAQFSLKRIRLEGASFIKALTTKLFWGEDIRNGR